MRRRRESCAPCGPAKDSSRSRASGAHFGIAAGEEVSGLRVLWPGGESEEISGILAGGFFTVDQGSGKAQRWRLARGRHELDKLPIGEPTAPSSQAARIVMASPLPLPKSTYLALDGTRQPIARTEQLPQLINLWATWCVPCVAEMDGWTNDEATLRKLGIDILALSVDQPDDPAAARSAIVAPFLAKRRFPFNTGLADAEFLGVIEVAGRAQIDKFESLPVPSSLLLDADGRIAFIYKGPSRPRSWRRTSHCWARARQGSMPRQLTSPVAGSMAHGRRHRR